MFRGVSFAVPIRSSDRDIFRLDGTDPPSVEVLIEALPTLDVLVLVNPHNPTGAVLSNPQLEEVCAAAARLDKLVLLDESFVDFADQDCCSSWLDSRRLQDNPPHVVVLKSLGKTHGLPGLRLGVLATANEVLLAAIRERLPIWNISSPAESLLELLPRYRDDYVQSLARVRTERSRFIANLREIEGIECFSSQANFVLCRLRHRGGVVQQLARRILEEGGLLIKPLIGKNRARARRLHSPSCARWRCERPPREADSFCAAVSGSCLAAHMHWLRSSYVVSAAVKGVTDRRRPGVTTVTCPLGRRALSVKRNKPAFPRVARW